MKRPLVLHIGLSKTGSSSIQRVLAEQRPALLAQGVYIPTSPGWANHALLPAACVNDLKILWGYHPATWEGLAPANRIAHFRADFAAEMDALPDDAARVILTAEQMGGVLRQPDEVARLAELLGRWFSPIEVIVYLRRQDQHAASAYSEWLRGGVLREPGLPEGGPAEHPEYDYGRLLDRWAGAFGGQAMRPRIFDRADLAGGDVVQDFLALTGITLPPAEAGGQGANPKAQSNPSLSEVGQRLLLEAGRRLEAAAAGAVWRDTPAWRRLAEATTEAMPGRGWRPLQAEARGFMERFAATNEHARVRFFPDRSSLFALSFGDLPADREPRAQSPESLTAGALDLLLHEVQAGARREALASMAQYRLNRRLGDRAAMRACLIRAVKFGPDMLAPRLRLAELYLEQGNHGQARSHAEAALKLAPGDPAAQRLHRQTRAGKALAQ